jgi:hypothetical protein
MNLLQIMISSWSSRGCDRDRACMCLKEHCLHRSSRSNIVPPGRPASALLYSPSLFSFSMAWMMEWRHKRFITRSYNTFASSSRERIRMLIFLTRNALRLLLFNLQQQLSTAFRHQFVHVLFTSYLFSIDISSCCILLSVFCVYTFLLMSCISMCFCHSCPAHVSHG